MTWIASLLPAIPMGGPQDHDPTPPTVDDHERLALAVGEYIRQIATRALKLASEQQPGLLRSDGLSVTALRGLLRRWCDQDDVREEFGVDAVRGLQMALQDMHPRELGTLIQGLAQLHAPGAPCEVHGESEQPGAIQ